MTTFRVNHHPKGSEDGPLKIATIQCDPASLNQSELNLVREFIAWPEYTLPLGCPPDEMCLSVDEILTTAEQRRHPEWWPDEELVVCKGKLQEGTIQPRGTWDQDGNWRSDLIEVDEPDIAGLLQALDRHLDELLE